MTYTCCSTTLSGTGNIMNNPMFFEPPEDDFSLLFGSPCIDAGDPSSPLDPDGTRADMGALYFHMYPGFEERPVAPTNFTASHNDAQLIGTLRWTNPSLNMNGNPLTELQGVHVYRNGDFVADVTDVVIGQRTVYDDVSIPAAGWYEWEIIPYNSYGDGYSADTSCWIGLDTPGEVQNALVVPDPNQGLECTMTWDPPVDGAHGGYFTTGSWTGQKIYRNGDMIANLTGSNTSYIDNTIPVHGWYFYEILYYNESGDGTLIEFYPNPVYVGEPEFELVTYDWVEISGLGTNAGITYDDQIAGPFNIGFGFPFYDGATPTQVWVCSNGWISFASQTFAAYGNVAIPSTGTPNNLVCPFWDDLNPSQGGAIYYYQDTANQRFIVEWQNVPHYNTGGSYTFEAIFYPTGDLDIMWHTLTPGTTLSNTVGIENATGTAGIQVTFDGSGPIEPEEGTGVRIYSVVGGTPDLDVELTYVSGSPIPASGGDLVFGVYVENSGTVALNFDAWIDVAYEGGAPITVVQRYFTNYQPGWTVNRPETYFPVPGSYAGGNYTLTGRVGDYPNTVWNESGFDFSKLGDDFGGNFIPFVPDGVPNPFEQIDQNGIADPTLPIDYALHAAYPNPFNPATTLGFALPEAARVKLSIYDIQGRLVARVVDGWRDAGYHEVSFDAQNLASGVYIYRIQANSFSSTGKMILMK